MWIGDVRKFATLFLADCWGMKRCECRNNTSISFYCLIWSVMLALQYTWMGGGETMQTVVLLIVTDRKPKMSDNMEDGEGEGEVIFGLAESGSYIKPGSYFFTITASGQEGKCRYTTSQKLGSPVKPQHICPCKIWPVNFVAFLCSYSKELWSCFFFHHFQL